MREKLVKIPYYGSITFLIYMPFHIFLSQWLSTFTGGLNVWKGAKDLIAFGLALLTVLLVWLYVKKIPNVFKVLVGISVSYGILHLLIYVINKNTSLQIAGLATAYNSRLFAYAVIGYGGYLLRPTAYDLKKIAKIIVGVSTLVCLLGLVQYLLPSDVLTHFGYSVERGAKPYFYIDNKPDLVRIMSTIREPNSLAAYLILPILLLVAAFKKLPQAKGLLSGLIMLHALILALTFSRSAALGMVTALATYLIHVNRAILRRFNIKYVALMIVALGLMLGAGYVLRDQYFVQNVIFHSDENTIAEQSSNDKHLAYAVNGVRAIIKRPLGHGPGTAGPVSMQNESGGFVTENYFLQIGYEVGIFGLMLFIAVYGWIALLLWRIQKPLAGALLGSMAGLTIASLFLHTWANEAVALQWWLMTGLSIGYYATERKVAKKRN